MENQRLFFYPISEDYSLFQIKMGLKVFNFICENDAVGFLIGEREIVTAIKDAKVKFVSDADGFLSLFSLSESSIVTEVNLKYTLDEYKVINSFPIGVSNEFIGKPALISGKGTAAVIYDKNNGISAISIL